MRVAIVLCLVVAACPAFAQTSTAPANPSAVPLPQWFSEIDSAKKGEVSRADFVNYRMKTFDRLDANKDGKLSPDELDHIVEPTSSAEPASEAILEERRKRAHAEFLRLDTNGDGFVSRSEAEAQLQSEFNQYDTDRDGKIIEPELRLIVQRALQRQAAERLQIEAARRRGLLALNDLIDMQMRDADRLDKNNDGRISQPEYLTLAGPADGPQSQGMLPYDIRKQLLLHKFKEIDSNNDSVIDRVELTAFALKELLDTDLNKDRFLDEEELKKAKEADAARTREIIAKLTQAAAPARPAPPRPSPPKPPPSPPQPQPQGTR